MGSVAPYSMILPVLASFFVGICFYVETMQKDIEKTLMQFNEKVDRKMWSTYVHEIRFHSEIIK